MTTMTVVEPINLSDLTVDSFAGRPVAVLGLARSGIALARFLVDHGARVAVYDLRPPDELADSMDRLGGRRVELLAGVPQPVDVPRDDGSKQRIYRCPSCQVAFGV